MCYYDCPECGYGIEPVGRLFGEAIKCPNCRIWIEMDYEENDGDNLVNLVVGAHKIQDDAGHEETHTAALKAPSPFTDTDPKDFEVSVLPCLWRDDRGRIEVKTRHSDTKEGWAPRTYSVPELRALASSIEYALLEHDTGERTFDTKLREGLEAHARGEGYNGNE